VRIQNRCTSCASLAAELNRLQAENSRLREKVAQYKRLMCAIYQFSAEHRQFFEELRPAASDRMAAGNIAPGGLELVEVDGQRCRARGSSIARD